jgi:hypothetical protein
MGRFLQIAARVAAGDPEEDTPIEADKVADIVNQLKRQLDLLVQSASRDNPQRAVKLLEGSYSALETILKLLTMHHEEVTDRRELLEDKMDQVKQNLRPIRMQIH